MIDNSNGKHLESDTVTPTMNVTYHHIINIIYINTLIYIIL
jgi:hypothetical protein